MKTTLVVLLFLFLIILSNRFVIILADASAGKIPSDLIFEFLLLQIPRFLSLLLPIGFALSALMTIHRMNINHEMEVIVSSGISKLKLLGMVMKIALVIAATTAVFALWLAPWAKSQQEEFKNTYKQTLARSFLSEGQFQEIPGRTRRVVYVEALADDDRLMNHVLVLKTPDNIDPNIPQNIDILSAKQGYFLEGSQQQSKKLVLEKGYRYQGYPGKLDYGITDFEKLTIPVAAKQRNSDNERRSAKDTTVLMQSDDPEDLGELFWRMSLPVTALILVLFAMSTIRLQQRDERAGGLFFVFLLILLYFNSITVFRSWVERDVLNIWFSTFAVHAMFAGVGLFILLDTIQRKHVVGVIKSKLGMTS